MTPDESEIVNFCAHLSADLIARQKAGQEIYLHVLDDLVPADACCPTIYGMPEKVAIGRTYTIAWGRPALQLRMEKGK